MVTVGLVVQATTNNSPVVETKGTNYVACAETLCMYALILLFLPSFYYLRGLASHSKDARRRLYPPLADSDSSRSPCINMTNIRIRIKNKKIENIEYSVT